MIVLLKDACTCAIASVTCFLTFLRPFAAPAAPPFASAAAGAAACFLSSAIVLTRFVSDSSRLTRYMSRFLSLARRCVHLDRRLAWTLSSTCIGTGTLAAERQATSMPNPAIATEVHEALDAHRYF